MRHIHILTLLVVTSLVWWALQTYKQTCELQPGKIILIIGVSSSGKSSVATELQSLYARNDIPFLLLPSDDLLNKLPEQWVNFNPAKHTPLSMNPDGLIFEQTIINGAPVIKEHIGTVIQKMIVPIAQTIKNFSCAGINIIYEGAFESSILETTIKITQPTATILITAPLDVLEQREKDREGFIGLTRGQFTNPNFFDKKLYDLTIDSSVMTPQEAAQQIYSFVK